MLGWKHDRSCASLCESADETQDLNCARRAVVNQPLTADVLYLSATLSENILEGVKRPC